MPRRSRGDAGGRFQRLLDDHLRPLRLQTGLRPGRGQEAPKLELDPPADAVVRRIFDMVLQGKSTLDVTKTLNAEGVASPRGKQWLKTTVHNVLLN